ncbi:MAG: LolA-related protein, partial [Candidatus Dormibacteria bacterium]
MWLCLPAAAAEPDAAALVAGLRQAAPARTAYTEVRFSSLLDRPLVLRGELTYPGPGRLGKRVDTPYREDTTIADGEVTVVRGARKPRHFSLSQAPELEGFLHGFLALLGGDANALAAKFTIAASGDATRWQLTLIPRDARLRRPVATIEVDGSGSHARCFVTREAGDDANVLLVGDLAAAKLLKPLTPASLATLCRGGDG